MTCDKARVKLICIGHVQETLPPTSDAAKFHTMRSHNQASVCNQVGLHVLISLVTEMRWDTSLHLEILPYKTKRQYSTMAIISATHSRPCKKITSCRGTKGCLSQHCGCRNIHIECIDGCITAQ